MTKKSTKPSKTMVREAHELAVLMGWRMLNKQEIALIELLRRTTYHGRNIVMDLAITTRRTHPWVDGAGETNTSTTYPASDRRFCQPMKD